MAFWPIIQRYVFDLSQNFSFRLVTIYPPEIFGFWDISKYYFLVFSFLTISPVFVFFSCKEKPSICLSEKPFKTAEKMNWIFNFKTFHQANLMEKARTFVRNDMNDFSNLPPDNWDYIAIKKYLNPCWKLNKSKAFLRQLQSFLKFDQKIFDHEDVSKTIWP